MGREPAGTRKVRRQDRSARSAQEEGKHPVDVMLDLSIATDLKAEFLGPNRGFNAEYMAEIINNSPFTFPGVSDGGAHTKFFTGGAFTTDFLRWLVRDEQKVTLEEAHYRLSALPAHAAGFKRSRHAARRRGGRRRGVRPEGPRRSSRTGSARSRTICRAANGAACSARKAIARSSSTARRPSPKASARARRPGKLLRNGRG